MQNMLAYPSPTKLQPPIMPQSHTIPATESKPLYIPQYPIHNGRYAPHLFWHVTKPATGNHPHKEEILFSMYREDVNKWSNPKRISHKNATICLINYDTEQNPPRISFASIYLPTALQKPEEHATHHNHFPHKSLTNEQLHTTPTGLDIFTFYANPNHFFTLTQHQLLSSAMLKRFSSDHPQYMEAAQLWSSNNDNKPTQQADWPTKSFNPHNENELSTPVTFGWMASSVPPLQMVHYTSEDCAYVIPNYPFAYGEYRVARFWVKFSAKTKTKMAREVAYCQTLHPATNQWSEPKAVSSAKATVCLFHIDKTPESPTFGLPIFTYVNLFNVEASSPRSILDFALNPDHYFNAIQLANLSATLLTYFKLGSEEMLNLTTAWAHRQIVPLRDTH